MHKTIGEAIRLVNALKVKTVNIRATQIVVCPTYLALAAVRESLKGTHIALGGQNAYWEREGAFTGEISAALLADAGCSYAILGHSERRQYFGETDEMVSRRVKAVLAAGMTAIMCVGETLAEREDGKTFSVVEKQLAGGLQDVTVNDFERIVIAYEPVWAIGTGRNATPDQAQEVHAFIRQRVADTFSPAIADALRIQYGGSVKPANAADLLGQSDIDGALVGGASLDADSFAEIVKAAEQLS